MKSIGEKAFYSLFLIHVLAVLYTSYYFAISRLGVGLWICAGIGFFCGFIQLYTPKSIIKSLMAALAPVIILFMVSYLYYQDFRVLTTDQREVSGLLMRSIDHFSQLNYTVFNNFKNIFIRDTRVSHWMALVFGFFLSRILSKALLKQLLTSEESEFKDGSILNKRYESKSHRFKRRF